MGLASFLFVVKYKAKSKTPQGVFMGYFQITKSDREFVKMGCDINQYRDYIISAWNDFVVSRHDWEYDGRTNRFKKMDKLLNLLVHLGDMIYQTETAHRDEVEKLKAELEQWTKNRGRKRLLTISQVEQVNQLRADGESCRSLARKFGVSERTIRRALNPDPDKDALQTRSVSMTSGSA